MKGQNILILAIGGLLFVTRKKMNYVSFKDGWPLYIWVFVRIFIYIYHGDLMGGISFFNRIMIALLVVINCIRSQNDFERGIDCLIGVSLIVSLLGLVEVGTGLNVFMLLNNSGEEIALNVSRLGRSRIIGFTQQSITYGLYMSMVTFLTIYRLNNKVSKKKKYIFKCILLLQITNILLAMSRAVIICFIACLIFVLMKYSKLKGMLYLLVCLLILCIIALFWKDSYLGQYIYMMLALLFPKMKSVLPIGALAEHANGIGDRFDLIAWVWETVGSNCLLGMGEKAEFAYRHLYSWEGTSFYTTKRMIEVYPLHLLFHYGFLGMISECLMYIIFALKSYRSQFKYNLDYEGKINFNCMVFVILVLNFACWLAVMQAAEDITLYLIIFMTFVYNKFGREKVRLEKRGDM